MKLIIGILCWLPVGIGSAQQLSNLFYSNQILPARSIFIVDQGYKIINTVSDENYKIKTFLLSGENLVVDTLNLDQLPVKFHYLGNSCIIMQGEGVYYQYSIRHNNLVPDTTFKKAKELEAGDYALLFNYTLVIWQSTRRGEKLLLVQPDAQQTFSLTSKMRQLVLPGAALKLKNNLVRQLPVVFALSKDKLMVYSRSQQSLFVIDKRWDMTIFRLPYNKDWFWAYFWDALEERHYAVKCMKDAHMLYELTTSGLRFVSNLDALPLAIYDYKLLMCSGSIYTNCDFYLIPIVPGVGKEINLLEPVLIESGQKN